MVAYGTGSVTAAVPRPAQASFFAARIVYDDPAGTIVSRGVSGHSPGVQSPGGGPGTVDLLSIHCIDISGPLVPSLNTIMPLTMATADYGIAGLSYPGNTSDGRTGILTDLGMPIVFYRMNDTEGLLLRGVKNTAGDTVDLFF